MSFFSKISAEMLELTNAVSAAREEYFIKYATEIQVAMNSIPEMGDSIVITAKPVATPLPPENFSQTG